jgi:hypothetical protein
MVCDQEQNGCGPLVPAFQTLFPVTVLFSKVKLNLKGKKLNDVLEIQQNFKQVLNINMRK